MSSKPPPPYPPPRPDLEGESLVPAPKPSRRGPPPIPLRPDLGEGVDDHLSSSSVHIPKIPPPTLPNKPSFKRQHGNPEIDIVPAQPLASSGAFSPFIPVHPTDKTVPSSGVVVPLDKSSVDLMTLSEFASGLSQTAVSTATSGTMTGHSAMPPTSQSTAHEIVSAPPKPDAIPAPVPKPMSELPSTAPNLAGYHTSPGNSMIPGSQNMAAFSPFGIEPISSDPVASNQNQHNFSPFGDDFSSSVQVAKPISVADTFSDPFGLPVQPTPQVSPQMAAAQTPQPLKPPPKIPASIIAFAQPSRPAAPCPPTPTVSDSILQISRPAPPVPTNVSPLKVSTKSNKPREPPQRPKSKPVCEPSFNSDLFQVGIASREAERLAEPIAPKRKNNKTGKEASQEDLLQGSGINNSAFQDYETLQMDNKLKLDEDVEIKKDVNVPTSKKSKFPTVIRTKPNGKEAPKSDASASNLVDLKELEFGSAKVKCTKTTVIKPQARAKPPPPPSKKSTQEPAPINTEQLAITPQSELEPQQAKSKPKPTIIIAKAKKDGTKKIEVVTSPSELSKSEIETEKDTGEKTKPKRMPSIIRPNRTKKDKNQATNSPQNSRGMPEGQSQESSTKLIPTRKAPPRPSPPKPGPPRPGPPKRAPNVPITQTRTQPLGNVTTEDIHSENTKPKGMAPPRPATIGRDIDADQHRAVKHKKKKEKTTVVSSVVTTKIEPSCIALYDYHSGNADDLSFKAGNEIFLVKRINYEWYIGRLDDCEGMIPLKFVEIIEDLPPESEQSEPSKVANKMSSLSTVALYGFDGQAHDELTFHAGDTILLTEMINDEWLRGTCNGSTGMFPTNFVDFTPEMKQKLSELTTTQRQTIADNMTINVSDVTSGPRCKALYDYHTDNDNDLNFYQDDIIKLVERINDEWLKGEARGKMAMFPAAYVDIIEDLIVSPGHSPQESTSLPLAKALHDYISDADGDLSFKQGDMITIVKTINEEWLEGDVNGQRGMFPSAFVEIGCESTQIDTSEPQTQLQPKGRALYDFTGETEHELTFKAGDEILLLQHINDEWMQGEMNNHIGQFPTAFIEVLVPLP